MAEHGSDSCEDVFSNIALPENFEEKKSLIDTFVKQHKELGTKVVLVTSGGTTVPMESRTVRFIDNFSVGTRGSSSAEYFLQHGYAVLFLHRARSLEPFSRHFSRLSVLDVLQLGPNGSEVVNLQVKECYRSRIQEILATFQCIKEAGTLLCVDFISLADYLHLLRAACRALHSIQKHAMLYLAAAVSDFYIPKEQMPEHKIQSGEGALQLSLQLVPKMLKPLVKYWVPQAFVVSFKLETDEDILVRKSQESLKKYEHQLVIANVLETRKRQVLFVRADSHSPITVTEEEVNAGIEIESKIIPKVIQLHQKMINS